MEEWWFERVTPDMQSRRDTDSWQSCRSRNITSTIAVEFGDLETQSQSVLSSIRSIKHNNTHTKQPLDKCAPWK